MFTKKELKVMKKLSMKVFGVAFETLERDDQDFLYCNACDRGLL